MGFARADNALRELRKRTDKVGINVVVTRKVDFSADGVAVARSVEEAISKAEAAGDEEIFHAAHD